MDIITVFEHRKDERDIPERVDDNVNVGEVPLMQTVPAMDRREAAGASRIQQRGVRLAANVEVVAQPASKAAELARLRAIAGQRGRGQVVDDVCCHGQGETLLSEHAVAARRTAVARESDGGGGRFPASPALVRPKQGHGPRAGRQVERGFGELSSCGGVRSFGKSGLCKRRANSGTVAGVNPVRFWFF